MMEITVVDGYPYWTINQLKETFGIGATTASSFLKGIRELMAAGVYPYTALLEYSQKLVLVNTFVATHYAANRQKIIAGRMKDVPIFNPKEIAPMVGFCDSRKKRGEKR